MEREDGKKEEREKGGEAYELTLKLMTEPLSGICAMKLFFRSYDVWYQVTFT